jgi:negative regulator of flagellin synthesis FlgM
MPPIEIGPTRPVGPVQVRTATVSPGNSRGHANARPAAPALERSAAFDAGTPPVDAERVAVIRKAVQQGSYPVIPTRIADAMIAAGMLLRSPQE